MGGLLAFLILLTVALFVAVVVLAIAIINITRHIRQAQKNVETVQRQIGRVDSFVSVLSTGALVARTLFSRNNFVRKHFKSTRGRHGRQKN